MLVNHWFASNFFTGTGCSTLQRICYSCMPSVQVVRSFLAILKPCGTSIVSSITRCSCLVAIVSSGQAQSHGLHCHPQFDVNLIFMCMLKNPTCSAYSVSQLLWDIKPHESICSTCNYKIRLKSFKNAPWAHFYSCLRPISDAVNKHFA